MCYTLSLHVKGKIKQISVIYRDSYQHRTYWVSNRYQSFIGIVTNIGPTEESVHGALAAFRHDNKSDL